MSEFWKTAQKNPCGDGTLYLSGEMQGRIFAELDGEILHKLDFELALNPQTEAFNNVGGNSLWPAPEGGDFAFNYPPNHEQWYVQRGINRTPAEPVPGKFAVQKEISLVNRKGFHLDVDFKRELFPMDVSAQTARCGVQGLAYRSIDELLLKEPCSPEEAVLAAWSLEQFPGSDGIIAFGAAEHPEQAINTDFYGNPDANLEFTENQFFFHLGGESRLQIGIRAEENPRFIGAFDPARSLLIIRRCNLNIPGKRINIADNIQKNGVYSAADAYSIFNGASLGFFELETIAPMQICKGKITGSRLESETLFFHGKHESLKRLLKEEFQFNMEVL